MNFFMQPKAPYSFEVSMQFIAKENYAPMPYVWRNKQFMQAFRFNGVIYPVRVESIGTIEKPKLCVTTSNSAPKTRLKKELAHFFNLDYDLNSLYEFMGRDPKLKKIAQRFYGFRVPAMSSNLFEVIVNAIVQQQISLQVAAHMTSLLVKSFGERIDLEWETYWAFPTPQRLATTSIKQLKSCKLSTRKAEYIKDFSRAVASNEFDPEALWKMESQEVVEALTKFRGIGRWTAELVLAAGMNRPDYVPADDLGVRNAVSMYYFDGKRQDPKTVRKLLKRWGDYSCGIIVYLLYAMRQNLCYMNKTFI
ncbi:MAG: DNA-3-methyladenine glycosylase 2 family protein [Candidatus Diapherotrites archaeon]|nr:DNA-3-methyladenine glycosylase 2 family protein [Candidatus Diapherotrites archaeon]